MTPVEEYFFDNNIEIWSKDDTGTVIYYDTDEGEFVVDGYKRLFKIEGTKKTLIQLLKKNERVEMGGEELTNFRREQLILKLTYDALVKANRDVKTMELQKIYREGGRLNWRLVELKKKAEELSLLYEDLVRSKVRLVEASNKKQEPESSANESSHYIDTNTSKESVTH